MEKKSPFLPYLSIAESGYESRAVKIPDSGD